MLFFCKATVTHLHLHLAVQMASWVLWRCSCSLCQSFNELFTARENNNILYIYKPYVCGTELQTKREHTKWNYRCYTYKTSTINDCMWWWISVVVCFHLCSSTQRTKAPSLQLFWSPNKNKEPSQLSWSCQKVSFVSRKLFWYRLNIIIMVMKACKGVRFTVNVSLLSSWMAAGHYEAQTGREYWRRGVWWWAFILFYFIISLTTFIAEMYLQIVTEKNNSVFRMYSDG